MNTFEKALLDAVLGEYGDVAPQADGLTEDVRHHSVGVNKEKLLLYSTRQDGCVQHLFLTQENLDTFVRYLQAQGYTKK